MTAALAVQQWWHERRASHHGYQARRVELTPKGAREVLLLRIERARRENRGVR